VAPTDGCAVQESSFTGSLKFLSSALSLESSLAQTHPSVATTRGALLSTVALPPPSPRPAYRTTLSDRPQSIDGLAAALHTYSSTLAKIDCTVCVVVSAAIQPPARAVNPALGAVTSWWFCVSRELDTRVWWSVRGREPADVSETLACTACTICTVSQTLCLNAFRFRSTPNQCEPVPRVAG
jgi:hypothetical protein